MDSLNYFIYYNVSIKPLHVILTLTYVIFSQKKLYDYFFWEFQSENRDEYNIRKNVIYFCLV